MAVSLQEANDKGSGLLESRNVEGSSLSLASHEDRVAESIGRALSGDSTSDQKPSMQLYMAVLFCCVSPWLFGISIAFTSPTQGTMEGDKADTPDWLDVVTKNVESLYASLFNIGAVLGAFSGSWMSEKLGRKKTLCITCLPHLIGWTATSFLYSPWQLIVFRVLIGWGVGVGSAVTPVYIGEIATSGLRGSLGAANQLSVTLGIFMVNAVGAYGFQVSENGETFVNWRALCLLNAAISLALLPVAIMPESPKWLAGKGRSQDATQALGRLRSGDSSMEADQMLKEVSKQATTDVGSSPGLINYSKSLIIALGMMLFQQLSGVNAVMMYTATICQQAGVEDSNTAAMVVMGAQVILTGISCLLMERAGRRALLLFGSACMFLGTLLLAYYSLAQDLNMWGPSFIALVGLGIYILGFSLGLGPIPWLLVAEIFPTEVRGAASSIATALNWACSFLVTLSFSGLQTAITRQGTFLMFSAICAACFTFVLTRVPETKGKSVEQVLALLQGGARNIPVEARAGAV